MLCSAGSDVTVCAPGRGRLSRPRKKVQRLRDRRFFDGPTLRFVLRDKNLSAAPLKHEMMVFVA